VSLAVAALRLLRMGLHRRAFELHSRGLAEAAQALWAVVEEIDVLLTRLARRR
jgi:hypothetical protein